MAELINPNDTLNQGRAKLNEAIKDADKAKSTAEQALANSEDTQTQLNTIVIKGDSSVEAAQARVDSGGKAYTTLKERLDSEHNDVTSRLAEKANIDMFKDDLSNSLKIHGTFSIKNYDINNVFAGLQGATKIGDKLYITCSKKVEDGIALLMELDYETLTVIRSAELTLYHANDIAYNPNYNGKEVLIMPHTQTNLVNPNTVSIVDLSTFTILENKILSKYVYNFSYDKDNNVYIGFSDGTTINIFDEHFNFVKSYTVDITGNNPQGSEVYDKYYIAVYAKQNSLYFYDKNSSELIKKFGISEGYGELESCINLGNGDVLLGFNAVKTNNSSIQFYKANLFKAVKIEEKSIINGQISYTAKEQNIDIYIDGSYTGTESDGSQTKPFKRIEDSYAVIPTNNCYVDLFIAPGTYKEKVLFQYFSGVHIFIQNSSPDTGEVKILSVSVRTFLGEVTLKDITLYGTNNNLLSSTNNAIELVDVFKFRRVNVKITNELNAASTRGLRATNSNIIDEGNLEVNNFTEVMQINDNSSYYTSPIATFTFSNNTTVLDIRGSEANISTAFNTAMGSSFTTSNGGKIKVWGIVEDGQFPSSTGDVVTVINSYVSQGNKSGRIYFGTGATNLPSGLTAAHVTFETFTGNPSVYLKAINFSITATKVYFGQISGTAIVWKSATLA